MDVQFYSSQVIPTNLYKKIRYKISIRTEPTRLNLYYLTPCIRIGCTCGYLQCVVIYGYNMTLTSLQVGTL